MTPTPHFDPARWYRASDPKMRILGSVQTLAQKRYRGVGPTYHKFGSCVHYWGGDLANFIAAQRIVPKGKPPPLGAPTPD